MSSLTIVAFSTELLCVALNVNLSLILLSINPCATDDDDDEDLNKNSRHFCFDDLLSSHVVLDYDDEHDDDDIISHDVVVHDFVL